MDRRARDGASGWNVSRVSRVETSRSLVQHGPASHEYEMPRSLRSLPRIAEGDFILAMLPTEEDEMMRQNHKEAIQSALLAVQSGRRLEWTRTKRSAL